MGILTIGGRDVEVSNLDKVLFPEAGITKGDLIEYYIRMSPYILPYLTDRPFTMVPYPHGVTGKSFYQKQRPENAPDWMAGVQVPSEKRGYIDYCLVNDVPSLVFMANKACIEMHAWFSRTPELDNPDVAVFDLDPSGNTGFRDAVAAARMIKVVLDEYGLTAVPKTSGMSGLHIVIPIQPTPFSEVQEFLKAVCRVVAKADPGRFTTERTVARRGNRVYLDAVQNARGKTIPAPYSVRPSPTATVSAPLTWEEVHDDGLCPEQFTMRNIEGRVKEMGDLFAPVYKLRQALPVSGYTGRGAAAEAPAVSPPVYAPGSSPPTYGASPSDR
jgi:bifunctional non-homologous end joining protein LigD